MCVFCTASVVYWLSKACGGIIFIVKIVKKGHNIITCNDCPCTHVHTCTFVGCYLATKFSNLKTWSRMGWGDNGCGYGLLGVAANNTPQTEHYLPFDWAHAVLFGECNIYSIECQNNFCRGYYVEPILKQVFLHMHTHVQYSAVRIAVTKLKQCTWGSVSRVSHWRSRGGWSRRERRAFYREEAAEARQQTQHLNVIQAPNRDFRDQVLASLQEQGPLGTRLDCRYVRWPSNCSVCLKRYP